MADVGDIVTLRNTNSLTKKQTNKIKSSIL